MLKEPLPQDAPSETPPPKWDPKFGDRILLWCFLASILINIGFGIWLNYADLYGEKKQADQNKVMKVAVYRPPVKQKPKPKPKPKPKIIPPRPKIIPKVVHLRPLPTPPRPAPPRPAPPQHFTVGHHSTSKTAVVVEPPSEPTPPQPVVPVVPEHTTVKPVPPVQPQPPVQPAPLLQPTPPVHHEAPPVHHEAPPPPPPVHHDKNYVPDVESAEAKWPDPPEVNMDNTDPGAQIGPCVVSFTMDTDGRFVHVRVRKSSGNSDYDDKCVQAISRMHGTPAIAGREKIDSRAEWTFNPSG